MNILKQYKLFINKITKPWVLIILTGLIILINIIVFPFFTTEDTDKIPLLDTRFYYSSKDAAEYSLQLEKNEKIESIILHGTVDLIYPIIYTLLFSCIIFYLKGGYILTTLPLLAFVADILENIFIILILSNSQQNSLYAIFTIAASISTPLKWCSILLTLCVIIYLSIRRIYEK